MARPRRQKVNYFSHDTDASEGKTLTIIEGEFGLAGYAFWYKLLERLGQTEGHWYDARNPEDLEFLSRKCGVSLITGTGILDKLASLNAIDKILWEHKVIWVQKFVDRLEDVYKKRGTPSPRKPYFCDGNCPTSHIKSTIPVTETKPAQVSSANIPNPGIQQSKVNKSTLSIDKVSPQGENTVEGIFKAVKEYLGYPNRLKQDPIPNYGKEGKAIKRMLSRGFSAKDIFGCWKGKVESRGVYVSMVYVNEDIEGCRMEGLPRKDKATGFTEVDASALEPDPVAEEIWGKALAMLEKRVTRMNYNTWLEKTRAISLQGNVFAIGTLNVSSAEYLSNNQRSLIESVLIGLTHPGIKVIFQVIKG